MIAYLKGIIIAENPGFIILENNGVGYKIYIKSQISNLKDRAELYIYQNIREDANDLYGFDSFEELLLFEKLISVNGVGPKAGMQIMSVSVPERIIGSILSEDLGFFKSIPGIGNKVAAKIILELKSKISGEDGSGVVGLAGKADDVADALVSLGYKRHEITQALTKIPAEAKTPEEKIRWCLKNIKK